MAKYRYQATFTYSKAIQATYDRVNFVTRCGHGFCIPDKPPFLSEPASKEWDRITPELRKLHVISEVNLAAVTLYCVVWGKFCMVQERLTALGLDGLVQDVGSNGYKQISHLEMLSKSLFEQLRSIMAEFGLTPSSRSRIPAGTCSNYDLFDDFEEQTSNATADQASDKSKGTSRFFKS